MEPKPSHLGLKYAEQFLDSSIAEVYNHRPPYPDEAIDRLVSLITDEPRTILDVGCGTGDLCRKYGSISTHPVPFLQFGEEYIDSIHSRNGFSRQRMSKEAAQSFDEEVRKTLAPFQQGGQLTLSIISYITWGIPQV